MWNHNANLFQNRNMWVPERLFSENVVVRRRPVQPSQNAFFCQQASFHWRLFARYFDLTINHFLQFLWMLILSWFAFFDDNRHTS